VVKKRKKGVKAVVHKTDMAKVRAKLDELSGDFWTPKEGKNIVRILPPWNDSGVFHFEYTIHYGFTVGGRKRAFPCLTANGTHKRCPVCELIVKLEGGDEEDRKLANRLGPRTKCYVNIVDRKAEVRRVKIWGFSRKQLTTILGYINDPDWGDVTDPEEGHDIVVVRAGTGLDTKYEIRVKPRPSPAKVKNLAKKLIILDTEIPDSIGYDELAEIVDDNFGELDADSPKKSKKKKKKKKKKKRHEEEEEELDEDEELEEDEDEEDEDEDDEDEEDDE